MQWLSFLDSKYQRGFTLVEMLVVLTISAILLSIAVPSFINIIANNRVVSAANEMIVVLNLAKSEAVKTGQNTVLCKSYDGETCDGNSEWKNGWILFVDEDGNKTLNGERIIRTQGKLNDSLNFKFRSGNYISFKPNGRINKLGGRFCFRNAHNEANSRAVIIYQTGRFRTAVRDSSNDDCVA